MNKRREEEKGRRTEGRREEEEGKKGREKEGRRHGAEEEEERRGEGDEQEIVKLQRLWKRVWRRRGLNICWFSSLHITCNVSKRASNASEVRFLICGSVILDETLLFANL